MRVAVVGAGMAGLGAACELSDAGASVVVFEKRDRVGGRVETVTESGYTWDSGATSVAPRGKAIEKVILEELDRSDLVSVEKPIHLITGFRIVPGDARKNVPRYVYGGGIQTLAELMAEKLDVRLSTPIEEIQKNRGGYVVGGEPFDAAILAAPIPQSEALLWSIQESRPVANVSYRPCLSVMLGYRAELPPTPYHALLEPEQAHPLTWLSLESAKAPGRAPKGCSALCAQLSPRYSLSNYERDDRQLVEHVSVFIERLFGPAFDSPEVFRVRRWKYSQPESFADFNHVNSHGSKLLIASDGLSAGRVEEAYEVGVRTARLLKESQSYGEAVG